MAKKKRLNAKLLLCCFICLSAAVVFPNETKDPTFKTVYNSEKDISTVILEGIEIPGNADRFAIGALFVHSGKKVTTPPCCIELFFTSLSQKNFKYKKEHKLTVWTDDEKLDFGQINWRESRHATAFIIADMFYAEELFTGMDLERFLKMTTAKKVRIKLGSFEFALTKDQHQGLRKLADKMITDIR